MIEEIGDIILGCAIEYEHTTTHTTDGLSEHGSCPGQQALNVLFPQKREPTGVFAPGTAFHDWIQIKVLPSGMIIYKDNKKFIQVIAHEQYIYYFDGFVWRKSPIDTVIWNYFSEEFEIWDLKSVGKDIKYIFSPRKYRAQVNFYAKKFKEALRLEYNPVVRILFGEKKNWFKLKDLNPQRYDPELGEWSEHNISLVYKIIANLRKYTPIWKEVIKTAMKDWSTTKKPYRYDCKYCGHRQKCLSYLGYPYTKENVDKLIFGGIP